MGMSGFIIKKNGEMSVEELLYEMRMAAERAGLEYKEDSEIYKDENGIYHAYCWISNYFTEEELPGQQYLQVTILPKRQYTDRYDWIIDGGELINAVIFEELAYMEEILLELIYEYLKSNPNDYFYAGEEWYYTYEDIVDFHGREFDSNWLYKAPKIKENLNEVEEGKHTRPTAGHIVKQSKEKTIYEIIHDVEIAAGKACLRVEVDSELYQNKHYSVFAVAHITEEVSGDGVHGDELLLYILFETGCWGDFKWIEENRKLFRAIVFHKISGREKMLLEFLDEYFKLNPNDYFVDAYTLHEGNKWFYTPEDIKKIKEKGFDDTWCYKNPYSGERPERITEISNGMTGIPAFLLKRNRSKSVLKIMHDVKDAAEKAGLNFGLESSRNVYWKKSSGAYAVCHLEGSRDKMWNSRKQQLQVEIRSTEQEIHRYDWIQDGGRLIQAITFPNISDNEGILLVFLKEYFKICPEDCFVVGNTEISEDSKWYFTQKEIEKAVQYGGMWCYKNPHIKLRTWSYRYEKPYLYEED